MKIDSAFEMKDACDDFKSPKNPENNDLQHLRDELVKLERDASKDGNTGDHRAIYKFSSTDSLPDSFPQASWFCLEHLESAKASKNLLAVEIQDPLKQQKARLQFWDNLRPHDYSRDLIL